MARKIRDLQETLNLWSKLAPWWEDAVTSAVAVGDWKPQFGYGNHGKNGQSNYRKGGGRGQRAKPAGEAGSKSEGSAHVSECSVLPFQFDRLVNTRGNFRAGKIRLYSNVWRLYTRDRDILSYVQGSAN